MKLIKLFLSICTMLLCMCAAAQNVGIGIATPNPSAMLEVASTDKGMLVPRMFAAQRIALPIPANGLLVYDIDSTCFAYQVGGNWFFLKGTSNIANNWNTIGNASTTAANFIGTTDAQDLIFKRNNVHAGLLSLSNTSWGVNANPSNNGIENIAIGKHALISNKTGSYNTAIGNNSLNSDTAGYFNTANGYTALFDNTTGTYNTAIGSGALFGNKNGLFNTAVGGDALNVNIFGDLNSALGAFADVASNNLTNATAIGSLSIVSCSNCIVLGTNGPTNVADINKVKVGIGTSLPRADLHIKQVNETYPFNDTSGIRLERKATTDYWNVAVDAGNDYNFYFNGTAKAFINDVNGSYTQVSDARLKKEISPITNILPSVLQLQPKTYFYKDNAADAPLSFGFIAQEVEKLFPAFVTTKGEGKFKAIAYQNFSVVAIQAIKEQQVIIENQNKKIENLEASLKAIKEKLGIL
jgi:Chaperone of endosialidase